MFWFFFLVKKKFDTFATNGLAWWLRGKEFTCNAGDGGLIGGSGRSPGEGSSNALRYSCLGNPTDRGAWWATVHRVAKSWTQLKRLSTHTYRGYRHKCWSGSPCPPPGDLPNPGIESVSLASPALAGRIFTTRATWDAQYCSLDCSNWFLATSLPL